MGPAGEAIEDSVSRVVGVEREIYNYRVVKPECCISWDLLNDKKINKRPRGLRRPAWSLSAR